MDETGEIRLVLRELIVEIFLLEHMDYKNTGELIDKYAERIMAEFVPTITEGGDLSWLK